MLNAKVLIFLVLLNSFTHELEFPSLTEALNTVKNWYHRSVYPKIDLSTQPSVSLIAPGLYLGNACAAEDPDILRALNITHVLTIESKPLPKTTFNELHITTMFIKAYDTPKTNLLPYFPMSNAFIGNALRKGGTVLVHCHYGVSRSTTLVIAYLMETHRISYEDAYDIVARSRPFVNPNSGFVCQLKEYERQNFDVAGYQRMSAFMAVQGRKHKYKIAAASCAVVAAAAVIVPVLCLV